MTDVKPLQRWTATGDYAFPAEEREDGEFVMYDDHMAATAPLHAEIERLRSQVKTATSFADTAQQLRRAAESQRDMLAEALESARDWFESQAKAISKGCGSSWDLMQVREQRDHCDEALARASQPPTDAAQERDDAGAQRSRARSRERSP